VNCQRNDWAQIIRACPEDAWALGQVVHVTYLSDEPGVWYLDAPLFSPTGQIKRRAEDRVLRPIRDPGDDVRDETLSWLPVPTITTTKEGQPA
jgi:hypothetical protein